MYRIALLIGLLFFAGKAAGNPPSDPGCAAERRCGQEDHDRIEREGRAQREARLRLVAILQAGPGDPEADAREAAEAGNFGLVWDIGLGILSVHGGHCRFPLAHPETSRSPLTLFSLGLSDVMRDCEGRDRASCDLERKLSDYATRYNRAMQADPRFPYADLCAVRVGTRGFLRWPGLQHPDSLAPASRIETGSPRNFGEAVRRATRASVARMFAGLDPAALDRPDDFGLTPLAWALIDHRPDIARLLLTRGADPLGGCSNLHGRVGAVPLGIALATGQLDLADAMLTPAVRRRLTPWPAYFVEAAAQGNHLVLIGEMLGAPGTSANTHALLSTAIDRRQPALWRAIVAGRPDGKDLFLQAAISRGDPALAREALTLRPSLAADVHGRRSPLGSAVMQEGETMDVIVGLLLQAGAAADSPADWESAFEEGEPAPTALVALAAFAARPGPSEPSPDRAARVAAQLRTLELLLAAGASTGATDMHGRPLAVTLVTGRFGPALAPPGAPLPPGWIERLVRAGMDINAPWRGSSALDWAEAADMTEAARELERFGGRRLRPADRRRGGF